MRDIAIYGAGGLGREFAFLIQEINQEEAKWNLIGFFDDQVARDTSVDGLQVLGSWSVAQAWEKPLSVALAVADPNIRFALRNRLTNNHLNFPSLIHPQCNQGDQRFNQVGEGVVLTAGVIITTHVVIEDFVIVNLATTIGHDVSVGAYSSIMPGCSISGNVQIGEKSVVGTGTRILQNISIGAHSVVGAGAVVTKSFSAKSKLIGIPATNRAE